MSERGYMHHALVVNKFIAFGQHERTVQREHAPHRFRIVPFNLLVRALYRNGRAMRHEAMRDFRRQPFKR